MATKYLDIEGGNDANDGSSYANRVKTFSRAQAITSPGDTMRVMAAPDVVSMGTDLTWVDASGVVTPASATWAIIDDCESGWTAASNVTITYPTTCKVGAAALSVAVGASFTTGKAAHKAISSTDLSAYQQLSFWMRLVTTATWPSNVSIKLCSDTAGNTPVDTITIPSGGYGAVNLFNPMLIDKGSAFGSAIQSIAIYVDSDIGAQTIEFDNFVAVKSGTGEISVRHLVGQPNSVGAGGSDSENWFPIRGFTATQILLDQHWSVSYVSTGQYVHRHPAGALAGKVQRLPSIPVPSTTTNFDIAYFAGTNSSKITISGGWNRTDMTTQTHHSWLSWAYYNASNQTVFATNFFSHCVLEKLHICGGSSVQLNFANSTIGKMCLLSPLNGFTFYCESSTIDGLYVGSASFGTQGFQNSQVADFKFYTTGGYKKGTMNGSGSTITCEPDMMWDNGAVGQNILTSGGDAYGVGYLSTLLRRGVVLGTVGSSSTTTSVITSALSPSAAVTDQFKNRVIVFDRNTTTANLRGQVASISASTSGGTLTVSALTTAPASGDTFMIV